MDRFGYYLGCPIWSNKEWVGELFSSSAKPKEFLRQYASVFNTVEGNTTFYALPPASTIQKWREETPEDFRFCFKFPQEITHTLRLQNAGTATRIFLVRLEPLAQRLGPFFIQLPPSFGRFELPLLENYLQKLPANFRYAVEVRHRDFFQSDENERRLNEILRNNNIGRVVFDTRALHAVKAAPGDVSTREAQRKKPKVPVRFDTVADLPFVRFVGNPVIEQNKNVLSQWAQTVAKWMYEGKKPYIFMHAPNDFYAPRLADYFHSMIKNASEQASEMPRWPARAELDQPQQLELF